MSAGGSARASVRAFAPPASGAPCELQLDQPQVGEQRQAVGVHQQRGPVEAALDEMDFTVAVAGLRALARISVADSSISRGSTPVMRHARGSGPLASAAWKASGVVLTGRTGLARSADGSGVPGSARHVRRIYEGTGGLWPPGGPGRRIATHCARPAAGRRFQTWPALHALGYIARAFRIHGPSHGRAPRRRTLYPAIKPYRSG